MPQPTEPILRDLYAAAVEGDQEKATALTEQSVRDGVDPFRTIEVLQSALSAVGRLYEQKKYFLTEMYMCAKTMNACMEILRPHLQVEGGASLGRIVIGTVRNDIHDVGKNIVKMVLEAHGFDVYDLGVNTPAEAFVAKAREVDADIIAMSSLITISMPEMGKTISQVSGSGLNVMTMVGGAPLSQSFADKINADGYAPDAPGAVRLASELVKKRRAVASS